jgi:hypothetical protein
MPEPTPYSAAAVATAARLPRFRFYDRHPDVRPVHPYMPEDDNAVERCLRDLVQRGDDLAGRQIRWQEASNALYRRLFDDDGCVREDVNLYAAFAEWSESTPSFDSAYDWRKARERLDYVAGREVREADHAR